MSKVEFRRFIPGSFHCVLLPRLQQFVRDLCVGPYDEDHPLYKYTLLCLESGGAYEEFMIAAHIVVGSLLGTNTSNKSNVFMNLTENDVLQISQMTAVWHTAMNESDEKLPPWW